MTRTIWMTAAAAATLALAGCGAMPDARYRAPFTQRTYSPPVANPSPEPAGTPGADQAEMACVAAGRDAGFEVDQVVGSRAQGTTARDVMLRVRRGGQTVEVRCNYAYDTAQARIMTL